MQNKFEAPLLGGEQMRKMSEKHEAMYKSLGETIGQRRVEANLTQEELARKLGRKESYISQIELGTRRFNVVEFLNICDAMSCCSGDVVEEWLENIKLTEGLGVV